MPNIPYTPPYSATGPWTNGVAPGLSAAAMNEIEAWIQQVDNSPLVSLSGSTSGTAQLFQPLTGVFKLVAMIMSGFRNGGGSAQNLTLPVAFTRGGWIFSGDCGAFQLLYSGSAQAVQWMTAFGAAGTDGSFSSQTTGHQHAIGSFVATNGIDTLSLLGSDAATHTSYIIILGS